MATATGESAVAAGRPRSPASLPRFPAPNRIQAYQALRRPPWSSAPPATCKAYADAPRRAPRHAERRRALPPRQDARGVPCSSPSMNEDLAAYSAKQRRQFLANLPAGDAMNAKRIAAYEASDNTQRCAALPGREDLAEGHRGPLPGRRAAGRPARAGAPARGRPEQEQRQRARKPRPRPAPPRAWTATTSSRLIGLLETRDPEAMLIVGQLPVVRRPSRSSCASARTARCPSPRPSSARSRSWPATSARTASRCNREPLQRLRVRAATATRSRSRSSTRTSSRRPGRTRRRCATAASSTTPSTAGTGR